MGVLLGPLTRAVSVVLTVWALEPNLQWEGGAGAPGRQAADLVTPISLRRENVRRERVGLFGRRRRPSVPRPEPGAKPPAKIAYFSLSRAIQASEVCGIDSESHSASAGNFSSPVDTCVGFFQFIEIRALKTMIQTTPEKKQLLG